MRAHVQLFRFCVVGAVNTAIYVAAVALAIGLFGIRQSVSNALAYLVASTFSFLANSFWSFEVSPRMHRYARFQIVVLLGAAACAVIGHFGDEFHWPELATIAATALLMPFISFTAHRRYTFRA